MNWRITIVYEKVKKIFFLIFLILFSGCVEIDNNSSGTNPYDKYLDEPIIETFASDYIEVYFSDVYSGAPDIARKSSKSLDRILAGIIGKAETSIDAALHELDNDIIAEAFIDAHKKGVKVRLVTETNYVNEDSVKKLKKAGIEVIDDKRDSGLMHNKYIIIDKKTVWTGSFNTTERGAYYNNNNGFVIKSPEVAESFSENFSEMFDYGRFGPKKEETKNPVVKLKDGTLIKTYFSPEDDVAEKIAAELEKAKSSIYFMAFSFTSDELGTIIMDKFEEGVDVRGVFEAEQNNKRYSEYYPMREIGIPVKEDTNKYKMHHKVMIIDKSVVIAGSYNFSNNAEKSNDENIVIIYNRAIAKAFFSEFQKIYGEEISSDETSAGVELPVPTEPVVYENKKGKININTATSEELENLPHIGPSLAEKIIEGRPYSEKEDIMKVKGIGKGTFKDIEKLIYAK